MATTVPLHDTVSSTLAIATHTLAKNDWQLLSYPELGVDLDTFVTRVLDTAKTWQHAEGVAVLNELYLNRAAQHEYSKLLHAACGRKDSPVGRRAYLELWNRYSRMVRFKMNDHADAEDVTQIGMQKIYEKLAQCREPGHFLKWAYIIMLNEIRQYWRKQNRQPDIIGWGTVSPEPEDPHSGDFSDERLDPNQVAILQTLTSLIHTPVEDEVSQRQADQSLRDVIRRCLQHETQSLVFQRLVLNGAEVSLLAKLLQRAPSTIFVLRHRALQKLRRCPEILALLQTRVASQTGGAV